MSSIICGVLEEDAKIKRCLRMAQMDFKIQGVDNPFRVIIRNVEILDHNTFKKGDRVRIEGIVDKGYKDGQFFAYSVRKE